MNNTPLYTDQINSDNWIGQADFAFDEHNEPFVNSFDIKKFKSKDEIGNSGVVFCGTNQSIKNCIAALPDNGSYILVTRDNDQSINEDFFVQHYKPCIKHWFAINCGYYNPLITAIPYGVSGIGGTSRSLIMACSEIERSEPNNKIYCRVNIPNEMKYPHERHATVKALKENPNATVIEVNLDGYDNFRHMRSHTYVACPIGTGADTLRISESIACGAIPIVTDCDELRQFESLPVIYTKDWNRINFDVDLSNKNTDKARMSYWIDRLTTEKLKHGIGFITEE